MKMSRIKSLVSLAWNRKTSTTTVPLSLMLNPSGLPGWVLVVSGVLKEGGSSEGVH